MKRSIFLGLFLVFTGQLFAQEDVLDRITRISTTVMDQEAPAQLSGAEEGDTNATWIHYYHLGNSSLKIYPNPAVDWIRIQFNVEHGQGVQLDIFDITGRRIGNLLSHYIPPGEFTHSVNVSDLGLKPGVYLVRLQVYSSYFTKKIIIN
jgi:hypothetical protein